MKTLALITFLVSVQGVMQCTAQGISASKAMTSVRENNNRDAGISAGGSGSNSSPSSYSGVREPVVRQSRTEYSNREPEVNYHSTNTAYSQVGEERRTYEVRALGSSDDLYSYTATSFASAGGSSVRANFAGVPANKMISNDRYNHTAGHCYPYYSSGITKVKSEKHICDSVRLDDHCNYRRTYRPVCMKPLFYAYYNSSFYFMDDVPTVRTVVKYISLDGYIVYKSDTVPGIITFDEHTIAVEPSKKEHSIYAKNYFYKDALLRGIVVFNGSKEMHLTRFDGDDKKLWRVIHTGKLTVYDDQFSLLTINNVNKANIKVAYNGQVKTPHSILGNDTKKQLTECVNQAYGLSLNSKDYSWKELLKYIDQLD
jgi:hypothetical protein